MITTRLSGALVVLSLVVTVPVALRAATRKVSFPRPPEAVLEELVVSGRWEILETTEREVVALEQQTGPEGTPGPVPGEAERRILADPGFAVLMADIDDELADFRKQGSEGRYHSVEENEAELEAFAENHAAICRLESIGTTHEGRSLWALRISGSPADADVPRILIFGLTHAREWISAEAPHHLIRTLLEGYGSDERLTRLVDQRVIWVVPVTNPDGLHHSQTSYTMWRKNRNPTSRFGTGVDVNRNFEVGYGRGSSGMPFSDVYRGPHHGSEAETRALIGLMERERFHVSLSFHSYSELILFPWGHTREDPPHRDVFEARSEAMKAFNGYRYGPVSQILYIAGGATDDTFFARYGCWSWTFELGRQFVPPESQIDPICEANTGAVLTLIEAAGDLARTPPSVGARADLLDRIRALEGAPDTETAAELVPLVLEEARHQTGPEARTDGGGRADRATGRAGRRMRRLLELEGR